MKLIKYIRSLDAFAKPVSVHFRGSDTFQTTMGGVLTICLYMYVIYHTAENFIQFWEKDEPVVQSYGIIDIDDIGEPHDFMGLKGGIFLQMLNSDRRKTEPDS